MSYVSNTAIDHVELLTDGSGAAITGAVVGDFTIIEAYLVSNPGTTAAITFAEINQGEYRFSFTPTSAGTWRFHAYYDDGVDQIELAESFVVSANATVTVISTAASGGLTLTLTELRRRVARRLGDLDQLVSTANGSTTTIVDTLNVNSATEDMKGRVVLPTSGTNLGLTRRITAQVDSTGTLTVTPALSAITATNDTFDVFNKRGKGFLPSQITAAINDAINDAFPLGMVELRSTISPAFDYDSPEITVPATFVYVHTVAWQDEDGFWSVVPKSTGSGEYGWIADAAAGEIRILGGIGYSIDGLTVRLTGYGRQPTLSAESDTCALNAEYIVSRACYHLCLGNIDRNPDKYGPLVTVFLQESQRLRTRVRTLSPTGSRGELVRAA